MISKFDGRCTYCGRETRAGVDTYDLDTKKSYHEECREFAATKPDPEAFKLADRLGFIRSGEPIPAVWFSWGSVRESESVSLFE